MSTATLYNEMKKTLMPQLRFQEFDGEWKEFKLGELTKRISEKNKENAKLSVYSISNVHGFIPQSQQFEGLDSSDRGYDISMYKIIHPHTFAYNPARINVGSIGYSKNLDNIIISSLYVCFSTKASIDDIFLLQYLKSFRFVKDVIRNVEGGVRDYLFYENFANIKVRIPCVVEQQKIASFLSVVDEKTQQLSRKKELLERYKKGVMQQLFSGKLRFKDENGRDYPDWKWVGGNELFDNISDKKHNSDLPILAITQDQGAIPRDLINYKMTVTDASVASYKVVQKGDFIISLRTFQGGIEFSEYHGICSPAYNILRPSSEEVDKTFYKLYLKTSYYIKQLQKNLEGIRDGKMISYKYFSEIKLPFPSKPEQQKIAAFLSSVDTKIESTNQQINQMQSFKKGLLQQLFV